MGALQQTHTFSQTEAQSGLTEIVLSTTSVHEYAYILPMLAHLSRQCEDRWLTWIAPRGINRQLLLDYGFALDKLRIIYSRNDDESLRLMWDALSMGNSSTVVVSHEYLSRSDVAKLEAAAHRGNAQALLLRHTQENW